VDILQGVGNLLRGDRPVDTDDDCQQCSGQRLLLSIYLICAGNDADRARRAPRELTTDLKGFVA
jgi:hypothetical protein